MSRLSLNLFNVPLSPTNATLENKASAHGPFEGRLNSVRSSDSVCVHTHMLQPCRNAHMEVREQHVVIFPSFCPVDCMLGLVKSPSPPHPICHLASFPFRKNGSCFFFPSLLAEYQTQTLTCAELVCSLPVSHTLELFLFSEIHFSLNYATRGLYRVIHTWVPVPMEARGVGSLGAGVVGACVLPDKGADKLGSSGRVVWTLKS